MSLATVRIYCMISPSLSGAMEDCSIVRVQQLQMPSPKELCVCVTTYACSARCGTCHRPYAYNEVTLSYRITAPKNIYKKTTLKPLLKTCFQINFIKLNCSRKQTAPFNLKTTYRNLFNQVWVKTENDQRMMTGQRMKNYCFWLLCNQHIFYR